jgi:hypothetical protein
MEEALEPTLWENIVSVLAARSMEQSEMWHGKLRWREDHEADAKNAGPKSVRDLRAGSARSGLGDLQKLGESFEIEINV